MTAAQNAITRAAEAAAKAQKQADAIARIAPFLPGEPSLIVPSPVYGGAVAIVTYKLRTISDLRRLFDALPPVACYAFRGTFAGVRPVDAVEPGAKETQPCDGVTLSVEKSATTGAYPCDQHAMSAHWWAETPAGRLSVTADFHHNAKTSWPTIWAEYQPRYDRWGRETGDSVRLRAWGCNSKPDAKHFRYGSGDPHREPGRFLFYFSDESHRENVLDSMED